MHFLTYVARKYEVRAVDIEIFIFYVMAFECDHGNWRLTLK